MHTTEAHTPVIDLKALNCKQIIGWSEVPTFKIHARKCVNKPFGKGCGIGLLSLPFSLSIRLVADSCTISCQSTKKTLSICLFVCLSCFFQSRCMNTPSWHERPLELFYRCHKCSNNCSGAGQRPCSHSLSALHHHLCNKGPDLLADAVG
jgi:hypothetical protein